MGATCVKLEPPSGDPMGLYNPNAYAQLHAGVRIAKADLKTELGQRALHRELAKTDVLLTSFRPSALKKLGLVWKDLHKQYPQLSVVAIVGAPGARAEEPGHDLTYMAENDLIPGLELPASLYADMGGSLMATEAVLQAVLAQRSNNPKAYISRSRLVRSRRLHRPAPHLGLNQARRCRRRWARGLQNLRLQRWPRRRGSARAAFCSVAVRPSWRQNGKHENHVFPSNARSDSCMDSQ